MTEQQTAQMKRKEMQDKLIFKIIGKTRKGGFQQWKMEEIAGLMDVSRATLYKYFSNKEEIIERIADGLIKYVQGMEQTEQDIARIFQQNFEHSVSIALLITDEFLKELQTLAPEMHFQLTLALTKRNERLHVFYEQGMRKGLFNQLNPTIIVLQNQLFQTLFEPAYLMSQQLTIDKALRDFYQIQKVQLFASQYITDVDDTFMEEKIAYLTKKITTILYL